jgi:hypothetical protein
MAVLTRVVAALAVVLGGCSLYLDDEPVGDDDDVGGGQGGGGGGDGQRLALPCIHEIAGGDLQASVADSALLFYACEGGAIVSSVFRDGGALAEFEPRRDWDDPYRDAKLVDLDGPPYEMISMTPGGIDAALWTFGGRPPGWTSWQRLGFTRNVRDITALGPGPATPSHWIVAGDNALRAFDFNNPQQTDTDVLAGRDYLRVVAAELDATPGRDLFFIAGTAGGMSLGAAFASTDSPPAFTEQILVEQTGPGVPLELIAADVDDDGIDDVIGGTPELFVRSSRFGSVRFAGVRAKEIAVGDLEGDGVNEVVFLTEDGSAVDRLDVFVGADDISLAARPWLTQPGDRLAVADLDGDTHDDVLLVRDRDQPSSQLVYVRSP